MIILAIMFLSWIVWSTGSSITEAIKEVTKAIEEQNREE